MCDWSGCGLRERGEEAKRMRGTGDGDERTAGPFVCVCAPPIGAVPLIAAQVPVLSFLVIDRVSVINRGGFGASNPSPINL